MKTNLTIYSIVILIAVLIVTVTIANAGAALSAQSAEGCTDNWLHFGYDSIYTGHNPTESMIDTTNIVQLEKKWGVGCNDIYCSTISRSPAIYNSTLYPRIYTGYSVSKLHAYNAQSGQLIWQFTKDYTGWAPQPVVSQDGIVFDMEGSNPTHLYAINSETGEELWEAPITFELGFSGAAEAVVTVDEANDLVYIIQIRKYGDGKLFALSKQTGEIVWYKSKDKDNIAFKGNYVLLNEGKIFAVAEIEREHWTDIRMVCIDASSQDIEIIFDKPESIELDDISKCTICNDKLIVTYCDRADSLESIGTLVVYDITSSDVLWQEEYSSAVTGRIACNTTRDVIYVPTGPYLYALDATTGDEIWRYTAYGGIFNPSIANGIVYFLSDNNMYALDEDTGDKLFSYPLGREAGGSTQVAICDGMVYFSGNGGTCDLYALGLSNQVLTPSFSPLPKKYDISKSVTISCDTVGATIFYTTNGDDPTPSSTQYLDPITVDSTTTIKVIAIKDGMEDSDVALGIFTTEDFIFIDNWSQFGYNTQYTSYNPVEDTINIVNVNQLKKIWGVGCNDAYFSTIWRSPAIYNGILYTSGAGSRLTAYDAQNGQMLWKFGNGTSWAPQPVVSEDGIVFYMEETYPTYLYAVDAINGNQIWKAPIGFELGFSGAAEAVVTVDEANDLVYIIQIRKYGDGKLFALSKQTGEIVWYKSKDKDNIAFKGNYVLLNEGKIFAVAEIERDYWTDIRMVCIDASSQDIEIIFDKPESIELDDISKCTICNDKLIVTYCDRADSIESIGTIVVYDITSSDVLWQENYSSAVTGRSACNTTRDMIYVPTDPYLYALDATTGDEIWRYTAYGEIFNPSIANGIVYFLSDNNMYALDEDTGDKLFSYPLGREAGGSTQVAICDGMVYFSGNGGTCDLYALGLTDNNWLYIWIGEETDGGSIITTAELQDAIHHWLEDIPVREHTLLIKDLQLVISLWLNE